MIIKHIPEDFIVQEVLVADYSHDDCKQTDKGSGVFFVGKKYIIVPITGFV